MIKRTIKFRMWDFNNSKFIIDGFSVDMDGWAWHDDNDQSHRLDGSYDLQQFTGLLDKNGKEIYEGDIVKGGTFHVVRSKKKQQVSVIEYNGRGFWVKDESFGWEGESMWDWEQLEVIGNIYQNAELLTT